MPTLYIVSTPIGKLKDITLRAIEILTGADVILCEDTRKTGQLLKHLNISDKKLISFYDQVEDIKTPEIIEILKQDKMTCLVSDSGTPLISDPGFKLVRACIKNNIKVVPVPGPSAVIAALVASGLPANRFLFLGYPPAKTGARQKFFKNIRNNFVNSEIKPTIIFYESPHRIIRTLLDMEVIFGDIEIAIARELTKIHEEIIRSKISEVVKEMDKPKGEFSVVFSL